MNLGIDFHDTITYNPDFFRELMMSWRYEVYIITGTPESKRAETEAQLQSIYISDNMYTALLMGYEYEKKDMTVAHFKHMREHKIQQLLQYEVKIYFDDNPYYVDWARRNGILAFQPILAPAYITEFGKKDPYFTCHLQEKQFDFLDTVGTDINK